MARGHPIDAAPTFPDKLPMEDQAVGIGQTIGQVAAAPSSDKN